MKHKFTDVIFEIDTEKLGTENRFALKILQFRFLGRPDRCEEAKEQAENERSD
jgi:hypothetical protein